MNALNETLVAQLGAVLDDGMRMIPSKRLSWKVQVKHLSQVQMSNSS